MTDLISRDDAIDAVLSVIPDDEYWVEQVEKAIRSLPSAEPVRHGKWIPHEDEYGEHYGDDCSECGEWYVMPYGKLKFCPNCGARMDKE